MDKAPLMGSENLFAAAKKHILFDLSPLDQRVEEIDDKSQRCYQATSRLVGGKSPKDRHEIYTKHIAANPQVHTEELIIGLTVALLTEDHVDDPNRIHEYYQDIVTISKDNLVCFSTFVNALIVERITKLTSSVLKKIFWIANQLFKAGAVTAESMCSNLVRQTAKSDLSERNIFMAENLIGLLIENRSWLIKSTQFMVPTVIYNLMRLINDHTTAPLKALRQREIDFVIGLIRERFDLVIGIGRDFLRQLQYLLSSKVPEFQQLFQDIYHNDPRSLHPSFEGPQQLLANRTPRRLFQTCLTYDMERKITYMATQVKFGNQKRYQEWFAKSYFIGHDTNSLLRCDIIRYICTIIHPSNEVLCSEIIPRWAIIGWLLTTSSHVVQSCRLALFFDWLAYDPRTDNIMNIEPGILIMAHSVRPHTQVTANLLEFLCRAPYMFPPKITNQIRSGIKKSLQQILEKRVIQSLAPIFLNPKFDSALKQLVKESFPEYCLVDGEAPPPSAPAPQRIHSTNTVSASGTAVVPPPSSSSTTLPPTSAIPPAANAPAKPVARPNSHQQPTSADVVVLDENSLEAHPSSVSVLKTPPSLDAKETNQDFNHNARMNPNDKMDSTKRQQKPTQRPPVIRMSGRAEGDLDLEPMESAKLNDLTRLKRPMTDKVESPTLEEPPGGKYNFDSSQSDFSLSSTKSITSETSLDWNCSDSTNNMNDLMQNEINPLDGEDMDGSASRVIYPFMTIKSAETTCKVAKHLTLPYEELIESFQSPELDNEDRCSTIVKMVTQLNDQQAQIGTKDTMELMVHLANGIVYQIRDDFTTRILPDSVNDHEKLKESLAKPLFKLCELVFEDTSKPNSLLLKLLVALTKIYQATSFLVLYFMRARYYIMSTPSCHQYIAYCEAASRDPNEALQEDLSMMYTYDLEMFSFILPTIFSEYVSPGLFNITNNATLIRKAVSALDPVSLQDLMCFCLTGTCKVFHRENPRSVIEASLHWESWEQYCFWKLLTAQSVPLENYSSLMAQLDTRTHPEAMSSIMLNLQKCEEPSLTVLRHLIDAYTKQNEQFVSAVVRHWAIKTDVKELAEKLVSLIDARTTLQVKRKGPNRANSKQSSLSSNDERILKILDQIRLKAPRNKLFNQSNLFEGLADMESVCSDNQRKQFAQLFAFRQIVPAKKKKLDKDAA